LPGSVTLCYGILSIAREAVRREDSIVATRASYPPSLTRTVDRTLDLWEQAWRESIAEADVPWMQPECTCLLQLARNTLFQVSPVDLQIVAGRDMVEGKSRGRADYTSAQRRIKTWAKSESGIHGVSRAARIIQLRLAGEPVRRHAQHCQWCLYLAALICWNFEFATSKFIRDDKLLSLDVALDQCSSYLTAATTLSQNGDATSLPTTLGMLVVTTQYLKDSFNIGMIREAVELLQRLTGARSIVGQFEDHR
jgi:hypothetical protein